MSPESRELFDAIGTQLVLTEFGGDPPRIGEEYAIEAIIGAGGFGLICRATQLALHRRVALKLYPLGGREDTGVREALREARSLARLEHPGIVAVHAAGESELITSSSRLPCAFVELQFVEGKTLRAWSTRELGADEVIRVLLEAGRALAYAHDSGVVHRDFKPENLMIDREGRARVIDFGLALATEQVSVELADWSSEADALGTRATGTGLIRGTPGYMAPEASQGLPRAASDQFAFAVVVREALTGKHPFRSGELGADAPEGGPACFERLKPVIDRAMSPSPEDRFASMTALCDAILAALGREPPRRRRKILAAGVLALSGAIVLAGYALDLDQLRFGDAPIRPIRRAPALTPEPEPEPVVESPAKGSCAELEAWAGTWEIGGKVVWTEYVYQLDWWMAYQFEFAFDDQCGVDVLARKYRPRVEGEPLGDAVEATAQTLASYDPSGFWRLPLRLGFAGDTNTYGNEERYELELQLDRIADRERVAGGFRRVDSEDDPIRTGVLLGDRDTTPSLAAIAAIELACPARCRVECAGDAAERACIERGCRPDPDGSDDVCGAPSVDFRPPLRVRAARRTLAQGESLLEQSLAQGSRPRMLEICTANAQAIAGRWSVDWIDNEARTGRIAVELAADGCRVTGSATVGRESTELTGEVTVAGTWLLTPTTPTTWLPSPLLLVGVGASSPALGTDLQEPARELRAHRRP